MIYNVIEYGAAGNGIGNDGPAIQRAVNACFEAGGGRVLLPSGGTYYSGPIELKANVELHVEGGAVLKASTSREDYALPEEDAAARCTGLPLQAFVYARGAPNIRITGFGTIDGSAEAFRGESDRYHTAGAVYPRPALIYLEACDHLTVRDITLTNSHFWTLHPAGCNDVRISGIRILNSLSMANSDGIDPDHCRNVRITDCHIEAADDCIVLKTTKGLMSYGPTENVIIAGCTLISTSAAIKLGTETWNDIRNVTVSHCVIKDSNRGLSVQLRDQGNVENISFSDIIIETRRFDDRWWGRAEPISVTRFDRCEGERAGRLRNVRFRSITCKGENGIYLSGWEGNPLEEVVLEDIRVEIGKWTKWPGGCYDRRPSRLEPDHQEPTAGVYCAYAKDVTLRRVRVEWSGEPAADQGAALKTVSVEALHIADFHGRAAHEGMPDIIEE
ncbi:MAG: glycoside hydrolase family 28 protein [Paenibacillaceae bacterium]|jgi:hypothetical protein|nr:glycoside hydrolase family 28 protein [Paenibacillaceae bacterium]